MKIVLAILLFLLTTTQSTYGQTIVPATVSGQPIISTQSAQKNDYLLPYEGLLPDNPLYVLKALRDRIIDLLIGDSLKKAEFTLLQADKRLSSAIALVAKGKTELAESTASKGQNYLTRTISYIEKAEKEGKDVKALTKKLTLSMDKHKEVLTDLAGKTDGELRERFLAMASKSAQMYEILRRQ